ncbi:MAG: LPS assembly lipoprotein LptE [Cytophagales bacterium]|nr:LPS assembly lipoprotein LptE [Bernardetiaceae bacterium]MDW8203782.1 LPS assembly lipoprotein LptE [Cytophagales bacterium]
MPKHHWTITLKSIQRHIGMVAMLCLLSNCAKAPSFTFSGINLDPKIQTMQIDLFYADVPAGPANLALQFTETLREYFMRNTRLRLVNSNGDLRFSGTITEYEVTPVAPSAGSVQSGGIEFQQLGALQRLTIKVKVNYENVADESLNFEQEFSFFEDFPQNQTLSQVEQDLIRRIFDQIILDIFNKSVANW